MGGSDFHVEFYFEIDQMREELKIEADTRLRELAEGHDDMVGASVALERAASGATPYLYQARVVVYIRPSNIVAVETADAPETALGGALTVVERKVRERRAKLKERWKRP